MGTSCKMKFLKQQHGSIIVFVALGLVAMIAMVGLVVDFGYLYSMKSQLQNAADAAALAGASQLDGTTLKIASAKSEAISYALKNQVAGKNVIITDADIVIGNWDITKNPPFTPTTDGSMAINTIKVVPKRTAATNNAVGTILGKIFNITTVDISAAATATRIQNEAIMPILLSMPIANGVYDFNGPSPTPPYLGVGWTLFGSDPSIPDKSIQDLILANPSKPANADSFCTVSCFQTKQGTDQVASTLYDTYMSKRDSNGQLKLLVPLVDMQYKNLSDCLANNSVKTISDCSTADGCSTGSSKSYNFFHVAGWATASLSGMDSKAKSVNVTVGQKVTCIDNPNPLDVLLTYSIKLVK